MRPGSRWVYRETDLERDAAARGGHGDRRTKRIANGITARVVHDVVTEGGRPVEVTDDWYAQDRAGNIWYLGEATTEYENGRPTRPRLIRGGRRRRAGRGHHARASRAAGCATARSTTRDRPRTGRRS